MENTMENTIEHINSEIIIPTILTGPTSAKDWKKRKIDNIKLVMLTSGVVVKIKPLQLIDCISSGYLPLELFQSLMKTADRLQSDISSITTEDMLKLSDILKKIAIVAVVEPKVVKEEPAEDEDTIWVNDIPESDLLDIFRLAISEGSGLFSSFRG